MKNERWQRLEKLFQKAIALPRDQRRSFLAAQPVSEEIRQEALSLVESHEQVSEDFGGSTEKVFGKQLDGALDGLVQSFADPDTHIPTPDVPDELYTQATLEALQKTAPDLEIISRISSGGMGEILKARQKALNREVAVKVLKPSQLSEDTRQRLIPTGIADHCQDSQ